MNLTGMLNLSDFSPLRGLPIKQLQFDNFKSTTLDFTPLRDLPQLEGISCSGTPGALAVLRDHRTLKTISSRLPGDSGGVSRPVAEFWAAYDAQQASGSK